MKTHRILSILFAVLLAACSSSNPPAWSAEASGAQPGAAPPVQPVAAPPSGTPAFAAAAVAPPVAPAVATPGFDRVDARAFAEALVFSLQQVGRPDLAQKIELEAAIALLEKTYPSASAEVRSLLDTASDRWAEVRSGWSTMSLEDRREVVSIVLTIGLGEPTARQLVGSTAPARRGAQRGAAPSVGDINVPYEGSDCWASAGCTGHDASSGEYTYEPSGGSFDSYGE